MLKHQLHTAKDLGETDTGAYVSSHMAENRLKPFKTHTWVNASEISITQKCWAERQLEAPLSTPAVGWLSTEVAHSYKCLHSTKISLCLRLSQLHILTCHHSSVKLYHFGECLWIRELHQPHVSQNWRKKCLVLPASDHDRIFIFCYYLKQVVAWHLAKLCQGPGQYDQELNAVSHYIQVIIIRWRNDIWPVRGKPAKITSRY